MKLIVRHSKTVFIFLFSMFCGFIATTDAYAECPAGFPVIRSNVPVGTVIGSLLPPQIFLGCVRPVGSWLLADGTTLPDQRSPFAIQLLLNRSLYSPSMFSGDQVQTPDLRGMFLRGVNRNTSGSERSKDDGDTVLGRKIADPQPDQLKAHVHAMGERKWVSAGPGDQEFHNLRGHPNCGKGGCTNSVGGDESRPRNASLYFYVKITHGPKWVKRPPECSGQRQALQWKDGKWECATLR